MTDQSIVHRPTGTGQTPRRVVIVDDSRTMRLWLRHVLTQDPRLTVVGEAEDANAARRVIRETSPDVVTLDVEMPGMSGLEFLDRLMRLRPMPVVMISSTTQKGSDAAIKALSLGAVDCLVKPESTLDTDAQRHIARHVFSAALSRVRTPAQPAQPRVAQTVPAGRNDGTLVLIGASTGGVAALQTVLGALDPAGPPVMIVQHMPASYLESFVKMLNDTLPQTVKLVKPGEVLAPGEIGFAPALERRHSGVHARSRRWSVHEIAAQPEDLYVPCVDALFHSAVDHAADTIAVILTGLGNDGAEGMRALHAAGARTIAQDEASCVVYGMPRAAKKLGGVEVELPLGKIGAQINAMVSERRSPRRAARP